MAPIKIKDPQGVDLLSYKDSHALLIGVSTYTNGWPNLPGVQSDLKAVRELLEKQQFKITVVEDPNSRKLNLAFEDFISRYGHQEHNRLLFYYAGHGHTVKRTWGGEMGYIVPSDAPNPNRDQSGFLAKAMDMQQIEVYAKRFDAKHALFVFDSCFSGSMFNTSRAIPESISYKTANPVRQFITAGGADEQVPDLSVFRRQFISGLEGEADGNKDGYVTGAELGEFLQDTVINYSNNMQHPQYGKIRQRELDKGDFVFQLAMAAPTPPIMPPPPPPVLLTGHVQVNVSAQGAQVYFNDKLIGTASPSEPLNQYNVPTGPLRVRVEAPGYRPETRQVQVPLQQWAQVVFLLSPAPSAEEQQRQAEAARLEDQKKEQESRIKDLVGRARKALAANALINSRAGGEGSAVEYAQQALALAPQNEDAKRVLAEVVARTVAQGEQALKKGDLAQANALREQAQGVVSRHGLGDAEIGRFAESIGAEEERLAELERQKAEAARLAEQKRVEQLQAEKQRALEAQIQEVIEKGRKALAGRRFTGPAGDNVVEYAEQALGLSAERPEAKQLLLEVVTRAVGVGETALRRGDLKLARSLHEQCQQIAQKHRLGEQESARLGAQIAAEEQRVAALERQRAERSAFEGRIAGLLQQGRKALEAGRLSSPPGNNALEYAEQVLGLAPDQAQAKGLISGVLERSVALGGAALKRGDLGEAKAQVILGQRLAGQYRLAPTQITQLGEAIVAEEGRLAGLERSRTEEAQLAERKRREEAQLAEQKRREEERIRSLLAKGRKALAGRRLISPAGDNAVGYAEQVLALSPEHAGARELLVEAVAVGVAMGESLVNKGDLAQAKVQRDQVRSLAMKYRLGDTEITVLSRRIEAEEGRLVELQHRKAEEERLVEQKRQEEVRLAEQKRQEEALQAEKRRAEETRLAEQKKLEEMRLAEQNHAAQAAAAETRIKGLVEKAKKAVGANRLDTPPRDNAIGYLEEVLRLQPQHAEARGLLPEILAGYVRLGEEALSKGDLQQAQRRRQAAEKLAGQYRLPASGIQRLVEHIGAEQQAEAAREQAKDQALAEQAKRAAGELDLWVQKAREALAANRLSAPSGNNATEYAAKVLRQQPKHVDANRILTEVVGRYVVLGEVALSEGRLEKARDYQQEAQKLVSKYRLPDTELRRFVAHIAAEQQRQAAPTGTGGSTDVAARLKELEERQKELNRREEELRRRGDARAPQPKEREVFIPPSF